MNILFVIVPFAALVAMIAYKYIVIRKNSRDISNEKVISSSYLLHMLKEDIFPKFEKRFYVVFHLFSSKILHTHGVIRKNVHGHYGAFNDAVNGKRWINKNGTASFFMKNMTEHKKELQKRK